MVSSQKFLDLSFFWAYNAFIEQLIFCVPLLIYALVLMRGYKCLKSTHLEHKLLSGYDKLWLLGIPIVLTLAMTVGASMVSGLWRML